MILGLSAAIAASLAIDEKIPVQKLEYSVLYEYLLEYNQKVSQNK
jgi:hypothetical protein